MFHEEIVPRFWHRPCTSGKYILEEKLGSFVDNETTRWQWLMPSMLGLDRIKGRTTWDVLILATTLGIGMVVCKGQGAAYKKDESGKQHPSWCRWTPPLPSAPLPSPGIVNQYKDAPPSVHMCLLLHIQLQESTIPPLLCSVTKIRIWASNQCKPLASEMNCTMYMLWFFYLNKDYA